MSRHISSVLLLFWCHYLFVNDWYRNRKPWKHSLTEKLAGLFRAKDSQLPFQKRMLHRYLPVWIGGALLAVTALVLSVISFTEYFSYYFDTAQCVILLLLLAAVLLFSMAALTLYARKNKALSRDMGTLVSQIASVRSGNLTDSADLPEDSDLAEAMKDLNDIQQGLEIALKRQMKSEQMKVELVSNVSHDIKTPLTSIISYIDLLKQEENLPDYMKDYIQILDAKSQRLKEMVQDVFEVSKAASGQLPVQMELLDLGKLLRQTIADMAGAIDDGPVTLKTSIPSEPVMIYADGQRLYRVFQNLLQNALSYSLEGSRVFLTLKSDGTTAVASMQNTSRSELAPDVDFTERFKRGDASRTDGGSGLGLSIAKSFTEACGGAFKVETIADLFVVTVEFPQR